MSSNKDLNDLLDILTEVQLRQFIKKQLQSNTSVAREDGEVNKAKPPIVLGQKTRPPDDLLTRRQAAEYSGYSRQSIYNWVKDGQLEEYSIGGRPHVSTADLDRYLKEKKRVRVNGGTKDNSAENRRDSFPSRAVPITEIEDWHSYTVAQKKLQMSRENLMSLVSRYNLTTEQIGTATCINVKEVHTRINGNALYRADPTVFSRWISIDRAAQRMATEQGADGDYEVIRSFARKISNRASHIKRGYAKIASHKIGNYRLVNWDEVNQFEF